MVDGPGWGEVRGISILTEAKQKGTVHRSVPQVLLYYIWFHCFFRANIELIEVGLFFENSIW